MRRLVTILFAGLVGVLLAVFSQNAANAADGTISGTITDEQSGDPIAGVTIYVYTANYGYGAYAYTDQNGTFTTSALPPGDYKIQYNAPYQSAYLSEWYNNKTSFNTADPVTLGTTDTTANASLAKGARISGTVTADGTGTPIVNATVYVSQVDGYATVASGYTDQNGIFTTSALPPGDYKIQYNAPYQSAYLSEWYNNKASYDTADPVTLGTTDITANASLAKGARISGTVTAEDTGEPISSGGSVYVYPKNVSSSAAYASIGQDGTFTTSALPPGDYKIQYNAPYQSAYLSEWYNNKSQLRHRRPRHPRHHGHHRQRVPGQGRPGGGTRHQLRRTANPERLGLHRIR